jgi:hypothetical protein
MMIRSLQFKAASKTGTANGKNSTGNKRARESAFMITADNKTPTEVSPASAALRIARVGKKFANKLPLIPENNLAKRKVGIHVLQATKKTKQNLAANHEKELRE